MVDGSVVRSARFDCVVRNTCGEKENFLEARGKIMYDVLDVHLESPPKRGPPISSA